MMMRQRRKTRNNGMLRDHVLFLGPSIVIFLIVVAIPFAISLVYSFTDWNGISNDIRFVGMDNFRDIFSGKVRFLDSLWFTLRLTVVSVFFINLLGLLLAVALTSRLPFQSSMRAAYYLPQTMGGLILGFIWQFIFVSGFPAIGDKLHLNFLTQQWLGTENHAFAALVIVNVWQNAGYVMVIMIAGLSGISSELTESAKVEGSSSLHTLLRIKLPLCLPYMTVALFWTLSSALKMFEINLSLTKGGPYGSTTSMALNIYNDAFSNNKYGLATAEAFVFFVIILAFTSVQMYISQRKEKQLL
ncbi:carbohydrate ABC transporter permease [Cohnella suwonensis]|uniref:Carbohydrate ABC transporter permease n=1 Tax=Cohnella suwonensis TaxID=696072 RepID=A0ABW0LQH3_9BACL